MSQEKSKLFGKAKSTINDHIKNIYLRRRNVYQLHKLHYTNRLDIYIDRYPLPIEYFEKVINDHNSTNYVY